jgi:phage terminase large subunit-like protein
LCSKPEAAMIGDCPDFQGWIRDASDERAADRGCWFDPCLGGYAVWWIERYCRLYEGRWAGEPAVMHACKTCRKSWTIPHEFDVEHALERSEDFLGCLAAGHDCGWQYDFLMRLFGWLRWDDELHRVVRRFRRADLWIPKKNAKSPTLSFIGWHLLVGDGVSGQKVYFGAKDGAQAKEIVGGHAVAVYEQSPEIQSCTRHKINEMTFVHEPTRSSMKPLSSSNTRTTKSKEGINGSILIDEVHVVDEEFMQRIKRAGISREEPLQLGVSTAGLDVMGYGKRRQEYGQKVSEGLIDDDDYLYVAYEADQKLDLRSISDEKAVEIGKRTNPNWGITILEREFLQDFRSCLDSTESDLRDFGTYRLNIWQASSAPWINYQDWVRCAGDFGLEDLRGKGCVLGLDLSRTRDMTSAVFVFDEEGGRRRVWPLFWLPEKTAERNKSKVPEVTSWEMAGHLKLCPNHTIDQGQVLSDIADVLEVVDCRAVYYDKTFAEWLTEQLEERHGLERVVFAQNQMEYAAPTDVFDQEVLDGVIEHPDHPVLNWQISHVHIYHGRLDKKLKRPVRPVADGSDPRTIDGVVAMVMGIGGQLTEEPQGISFAFG